MSLITLTTDFGTRDHYVASMKGVILTVAPNATIVDITHDIRAQDIVHAAFVFRQAFPYFPESTIHVVVIDPGVGTPRRLLAARYAGQTVLAPDNGLLSIIHQDFPLEALREIANERWFVQEPSTTFHGRDVLAPVAGQLAAGRPFEEVGPITNKLEVLNLADPVQTAEDGLKGVVVHIDRFGNLITNIRRSDLERWIEARGAAPQVGHGAPKVYVGDTVVGPLRKTYADAGQGEILALIGSSDLLEIAVNAGSGAARLRAEPGQAVLVR